MRPALSVFTTADQSCAVAVTLCSKNKDKKSESNSQRLQFNMSGCIPYRRRPPPVRNMRAVLKKASYGTRRIFRSPPCSKQASGVRKGNSVPETPSSGTRCSSPPSYGTGCSSFRGALHRKPPSGVWNEAIGCDRCLADPLLPTTFVNYAGKLHNEGCHSIGSLR